LKLRQRIKFYIVGLLGSIFVKLLIGTLRVKTIEAAKRPEDAVIYCFWHSQLLPLAHLYRRRNIHVLVSSHRDGEYIMRVIERLGFGTVRGSSTRGGVKVIAGALAKLRQGIDIAVTPDGPRGPAQQFKPGAIFLAKESGAPLVLGAAVPAKAWRFKSWDRFIVPKPFSRLTLIKSEPIYIPKDISSEDLEKMRLEMENRLNEMTRQAEESIKDEV